MVIASTIRSTTRAGVFLNTYYITITLPRNPPHHRLVDITRKIMLVNLYRFAAILTLRGTTFEEVFSCANTEEENVFKRLGIGRRRPDDPFFAQGDRVCCAVERLGIIDESFEDIDCEKKSFPCSVPTCKLTFPSISHFEVHYSLCHRFVCSQCKKSLPSAHLLDLHLSEVHDSFFKVQAEHKSMYRCFVESCDFMSQKPDQRRKHCIEEHKFPHDFRFDCRKSSKGNINESKVERPENTVTGNVNRNPVRKGTFTFGQSTVKGNLFVPRQCIQSVSQGKGKKVKPKTANNTNSDSKIEPLSDESILSLTELMDTLPPT